MSVSKLRPIHVIIIGAVVCIAIISLLYFLVITKYNDRIAALKARETAAQSVVDTLPAAQRSLAEAITNFNMTKARYSRVEQRKMAPVSFEDRTEGMIAQWKEQGEVLGPMLNSFMKKAKIKNTASFSVQAAGVNPNQLETYLIRLPVGSVTVTGTFREILDHIKIWQDFGRLVQLDGLSISGQSPNLTGSYSVTVIQFPRGGVGPDIPMASGSGGGMMGGMPGMPGMMGGMPGGAVMPLGGMPPVK